MTIALDFNLCDRMDLPNRRPLAPNRADVLKVINQPPADPHANVLVHDVVEVGFDPFMERTSPGGGLDYDSLTDVVEIRSIGDVYVPVHLVGRCEVAIRRFTSEAVIPQPAVRFVWSDLRARCIPFG